MRSMSSFGCACSGPPVALGSLGASVKPLRREGKGSKPTGIAPINRLRERAADARRRGSAARKAGHVADAVQWLNRALALDASVDLLARLPGTASIVRERAQARRNQGRLAVSLAVRAIDSRARTFHTAMAQSFGHEADLLDAAERRHRPKSLGDALGGWFGAVDTANPLGKKRGWYKDSTYGYFFDPKKGITVYRDGKQIKVLALGGSSYTRAYNNLFAAGGKDPAMQTTKVGAGLPGIKIDTDLVKKGIEAGASVAVAALSAGGKASGKRKKKGGTPTGVEEEIAPSSGLPSWTPYAVGAGLLLLAVGGFALSGGQKAPAATAKAA